MLPEAENLLRTHDFNVPFEWAFQLLYIYRDEIMAVLEENDRENFMNFIQWMEDETYP